MWKDLKDKMKRWFESEERTDDQPVHTKEERHEINAKTKMTYRYPKQGEFRFPVIPDQPEQPDQTDQKATTYQRTRKRKQASEENQPQERVSKWERQPEKKETSAS